MGVIVTAAQVGRQFFPPAKWQDQSQQTNWKDVSSAAELQLWLKVKNQTHSLMTVTDSGNSIAVLDSEHFFSPRARVK